MFRDVDDAAMKIRMRDMRMKKTLIMCLMIHAIARQRPDSQNKRGRRRTGLRPGLGRKDTRPGKKCVDAFSCIDLQDRLGRGSESVRSSEKKR